MKKLQVEVGKSSKLPREVQGLIRMIFDIESMKRTMAEFEVILFDYPFSFVSSLSFLQPSSVWSFLLSYNYRHA